MVKVEVILVHQEIQSSIITLFGRIFDASKIEGLASKNYVKTGQQTNIKTKNNTTTKHYYITTD